MQAPGSKVFFSYARADSEFVLRLAEDMRSAGVDLWIDQLDIPTGARWDQTVENALKACPRFLLVLSPISVASQNVMDEVAFAIDQNKEILPILYQNCDTPFRIKRLQRIDFTEDYNKAFAKLLEALDASTSENHRGVPSNKLSSNQRIAHKRTPINWAAMAGIITVLTSFFVVLNQTGILSVDNRNQSSIPDISGPWKNSDSQLAIIKQDGKKVWYDLNNTGFRHHAEGAFVDHNIIEMIQTRERIQDLCTTHMKLKLTVNESADKIDTHWKSMDNNCDLRAGDEGDLVSWKDK